LITSKQIQEQIDILLQEGVYDPSIFKAIFTAGGSGSGKSFIAGKVSGGLGFRVVNSDDMFSFLMNKSGIPLDLSKTPEKDWSKVVDVRDISKQKTDLKKRIYLEGRLGVIIDGTGADYIKIKSGKDKMESAGYDTFMIFVDTSLEVSKKRNAERPRRVPDSVLEIKWKESQDNKKRYQSLFGNNMVIIRNDSPIEQEEAILSVVWKQVMKFSQRPPSSPIAKEWIQQELERKRR